MISQRSPELMTWAETAVLMGCSIRTLQRLKSQGLIGYVTIGATVYFSPADVDEYLGAQRTAPKRTGRKRKVS
jgi:excisionase family DNA binding protein